MPTYNYECPNCNAIQVEIFPINVDLPTPICPNPDCKKPMIRKFGIQTIRFNGTGWGKDAK